MIKEYFNDLVSGIEEKIAHNPESRTPRKVYALEVARLGQRLYGGDHCVAWCGVAAPFDLLTAMGVTSCFVEFVGAMLASTGMAPAFMEEAEHAGFASDICAYHRSVMGAAQKNMMPIPDFLIATSCPCSGGLAIMENLAKEFEKDLFVLNIPQEASPAGVQYLADQMRDMTAFVADQTGKPLKDDALSEVIEQTNQVRQLMADVYTLAQSVPSPANSVSLSNFGIVMALLMGSPAGVEVAQAYFDDFSKKVAHGVSGAKNEKFRLLWIQNRIQYKNPLIPFLENELGAVIVADELNSITWEAIDPADPYTGFAKRAISIPFNGWGATRISHLQKMAKQFKVDGAINPCHWGCRQGTGMRGLISDGFKEIGVPTLNLEVDCVDSRNFAEGQLKTRLEAFIEILEARRG
jgi:benzoyl-CoA reductase/2-hydroxyglutaryl-CoA dehydratase subunit BcrC/BadD/HgdB